MFSLKQVFQYTSYFFIAVLLINLSEKVISLYIDFGFSTYWPFGIFHPRFPTIENILIAIITVAIFTVVIRNYSKILSRTSYLYGTIFLLIMLSNSVTGLAEVYKFSTIMMHLRLKLLPNLSVNLRIFKLIYVGILRYTHRVPFYFIILQSKLD